MYPKMKRVNVNLSDDDFEWLKSECINVSAWIRTVIKRKRNTSNDVSQEVENDFEKTLCL